MRRDDHGIPVVEDDVVLRKVAVAGLEEAGCEVTEAASGGQVLRFPQPGIAVDALWTDVRMSEAQSKEVARAYRERWPAYRYVTGPAEFMQPAPQGAFSRNPPTSFR